MVKYKYIAYGKVTVTKDTDGLADVNPFKYKGYYFDLESGMYYCHTRYYVPEWGRWLNADSPLYTDTYEFDKLNFFTYCGNSPYFESRYRRSRLGILGAFEVACKKCVG